MDEQNNEFGRNVQKAPNHGQGRSRDLESTRNEEYAAEFTADDYNKALDEDDIRNDAETNTTYGWIGIALSIIAFFMWPIIMGGAGIILGFVSRSRGADTLGNIAIAAGAIAIVITLFILPFV
ncbi:hypothetical protein [Virgibacillus sp. YIM 98842]|uniref:hypothetical protein n=1 Tax=Virgibacillus sp. YIM 98842 TaxID=2663533 RepID=UPI0013DCBE32|nr:hypothetical protein [Virgibacillus sp. YIM 98842]